MRCNVELRNTEMLVNIKPKSRIPEPEEEHHAEDREDAWHEDPEEGAEPLFLAVSRGAASGSGGNDAM